MQRLCLRLRLGIAGFGGAVEGHGPQRSLPDLPRETYECMGDVPNVTFPCAALHDPATGRVAVYYGCADTVTGLAFGYIPEIIDFTKQNSIL